MRPSNRHSQNQTWGLRIRHVLESDAIRRENAHGATESVHFASKKAQRIGSLVMISLFARLKWRLDSNAKGLLSVSLLVAQLT